MAEAYGHHVTEEAVQHRRVAVDLNLQPWHAVGSVKEGRGLHGHAHDEAHEEVLKEEQHHQELVAEVSVQHGQPGHQAEAVPGNTRAWLLPFHEGFVVCIDIARE